MSLTSLYTLRYYSLTIKTVIVNFDLKGHVLIIDLK